MWRPRCDGHRHGGSSYAGLPDARMAGVSLWRDEAHLRRWLVHCVDEARLEARLSLSGQQVGAMQNIVDKMVRVVNEKVSSISGSTRLPSPCPLLPPSSFLPRLPGC